MPSTEHPAVVRWQGTKDDLRAHHLTVGGQEVGGMDATRFTQVTLRPRVEFEGLVEAETLSRLHHPAHERCFIANTVNCPVEVA